MQRYNKINSKKVRETNRIANQKWRKRNPEYIKNWMKSENGKNFWKKFNAKRKRNMNWILMFPNPFDNSVLVEYHHITNAYVVAIPKDLHQLYLGKNHRENTMEIVKQVYLND